MTCFLNFYLKKYFVDLNHINVKSPLSTVRPHHSPPPLTTLPPTLPTPSSLWLSLPLSVAPSSFNPVIPGNPFCVVISLFGARCSRTTDTAKKELKTYTPRRGRSIQIDQTCWHKKPQQFSSQNQRKIKPNNWSLHLVKKCFFHQWLAGKRFHRKLRKKTKRPKTKKTRKERAKKFKK